jgi:hypothetical protein
MVLEAAKKAMATAIMPPYKVPRNAIEIVSSIEKPVEALSAMIW